MARYGNAAEEAVEKVLNKLRDEKFISGFLRNCPSDRLDSEGIDFLIIKKEGLALPLQVKTTGGNISLEEKRREHLRKHPLIHFLICVPVHLLSSDPDRVYEKVEKELKDILNS